jgi:hypothetical protein
MSAGYVWQRPGREGTSIDPMYGSGRAAQIVVRPAARAMRGSLISESRRLLEMAAKGGLSRDAMRRESDKLVSRLRRVGRSLAAARRDPRRAIRGSPEEEALTEADPERQERLALGLGSNAFGDQEPPGRLGKHPQAVSRVLAEEGGHWSDTLIWAKDRFVSSSFRVLHIAFGQGLQSRRTAWPHGPESFADQAGKDLSVPGAGGDIEGGACASKTLFDILN